jgi:serine protease AprX
MQPSTNPAHPGSIHVLEARSWGQRRTGLVALVATALVLLVAGTTMPAGAEGRLGGSASVIVMAAPGSVGAVAEQVAQLGGDVQRRLPVLDTLIAEIPRPSIPALQASAFVTSVTPDVPVHMNGLMDGYDTAADAGSMRSVNEIIHSKNYWDHGITGAGVDVALIDTGVVPVNGLTYPGQVVNGPDLSFESQYPSARYLDSYGHGTHMAGIIAGRDDAVTDPRFADPTTRYMGVAPGARIVSVKVADSQGAVDVSQVLAGIDWVVQHRDDPGFNIRVLNLSFGTDGVQDYMLDPLTYAVEVAWRKGIAVVVAAGNGGFGTTKLNNPAYDPMVIAVGAANSNGTPTIQDDTIPSFSSCGDGTRNPDVVAPGQSIVSLRSPGSYADLNYASARVGSTPRFFKGSGTSQSAAVISGAAALLIQQRPAMTPDQLKKLLMQTATPVPLASARCQGAGMVDLKWAAPTPTVAESTQTSPLATGLGTLQGARGTNVLSDGTVALSGEMDIFGTPWNPADWTGKSWSESSWTGGTWNGKSWSGSEWSGTSWTGKSWSGVVWDGKSWSGKSWSSMTWSGKSWSMTAKSWSSKGSWTNRGWTSKTFAANAWSTGKWG